MKGNTNANCYPQHRRHDLRRLREKRNPSFGRRRRRGKSRSQLENKNAVITFDESKTDTDALIDAVEDGGYDVAL